MYAAASCSYACGTNPSSSRSRRARRSRAGRRGSSVPYVRPSSRTGPGSRSGSACTISNWERRRFTAPSMGAISRIHSSAAVALLARSAMPPGLDSRAYVSPSWPVIRTPRRSTRPSATSRIAWRSVPTARFTASNATPPGSDKCESRTSTSPPTRAPRSRTAPSARTLMRTRSRPMVAAEAVRAVAPGSARTAFSRFAVPSTRAPSSRMPPVTRQPSRCRSPSTRRPGACRPGRAEPVSLRRLVRAESRSGAASKRQPRSTTGAVTTASRRSSVPVTRAPVIRSAGTAAPYGGGPVSSARSTVARTVRSGPHAPPGGSPNAASAPVAKARRTRRSAAVRSRVSIAVPLSPPVCPASTRGTCTEGPPDAGSLLR